MMIWLLALLLLSATAYAIYRFYIVSRKNKLQKINRHYTFKI